MIDQTANSFGDVIRTVLFLCDKIAKHCYVDHTVFTLLYYMNSNTCFSICSATSIYCNITVDTSVCGKDRPTCRYKGIVNFQLPTQTNLDSLKLSQYIKLQVKKVKGKGAKLLYGCVGRRFNIAHLSFLGIQTVGSY